MKMYYFSHSCTQFVNIYLSIQSQYILYLLNYFYTSFIIFLFIFWLSVDNTVSLLLSTLFRSVLVKILFYLSSKENVQKLNLTETIDQVMMPEWGESQNRRVYSIMKACNPYGKKMEMRYRNTWLIIGLSFPSLEMFWSVDCLQLTESQLL